MWRVSILQEFPFQTTGGLLDAEYEEVYFAEYADFFQAMDVLKQHMAESMELIMPKLSYCGYQRALYAQTNSDDKSYLIEVRKTFGLKK